MTKQLLIFLLVGTASMGVPILWIAKKFQIPVWKGILITLLLTIVGTAGTFLMFYVENGQFGGLSFYGAVFLVPVVFFPASLLLRVPFGRMTDLCALGECIMLALMKVHCKISGCCIGRVLSHTAAGEIVRFPSQIAELITALILFAVLFRWAWMGKNIGRLYPMYLLLYGSTRFVLNIFRDAWVVKETILPMGNIWSLVAIALGIVWLVACQRYPSPKKQKEQD
jgi:prolipoprotein diacylglyceryltransferase